MIVSDPHIVVIFGASGDLTKRKLIPAIYELHSRHLLPEKFAVVGASRTELTDDNFRKRMQEFLPDDENQNDDFLQQIILSAAGFQ